MWYSLLLLSILLSAGLTAQQSSEAGEFPSLTLQPAATGMENPVGIAHAGDSSGRLFIVLQRGQVLIFDGTRVLPSPFLDIQDRVRSGGEQGLLGLVFHPEFVENGRFFVNYTDRQGQTVISRYTVSDDPNLADQQSEFILLTIPQPFANHNGGQLQFGPDGFLYIGTGDGGAGGDPDNRAQNLEDLLGKMLRIDVNGDDFPSDPTRNYAIPLDNPFHNTPDAQEEIWAYGLRNPWRFSFDRSTGDLFIGDVGQSAWEEIHRQRTTSSGGENYGWRLMEGRHCFNPAVNCTDGSLELPIIEYPHTHDGEFVGCAVIGGYRYRGQGIPPLTGLYLFGDFCTGTIWAARETGGHWEVSRVLDTGLSITSFGEDEPGELYLSESSTGSIHRIAVQGVTGCLSLNGIPLSDRRVNLTQAEEPKQSLRTDSHGCFHAEQIAPGKKFQIGIKGPVAPE